MCAVLQGGSVGAVLLGLIYAFQEKLVSAKVMSDYSTTAAVFKVVGCMSMLGLSSAQWGQPLHM